MEAGKGTNMTLFFCVMICFVRCETERATTIAEALGEWGSIVLRSKPEKTSGLKSTEAVEVKLQGQFPPIKHMDSSLSILEKCEKLSLSTNDIEQIENLDGLKSLKFLSLERNYIKTLEGLEPVKNTLEELWISYNQIEKLDGVIDLTKLKVLMLSNNHVKDINEVKKLNELPLLEDLLFVGNPLEISLTEKGVFRLEIKDILGRLKKLDGVPIIREEEEEEAEVDEED